MRRIWRLPFGERLLWFTPALCSSPGHAPTHEESFSGEGKVSALAPTSAIICCAESTPSPGDQGQPRHCVVMLEEETCGLLVELFYLLFDKLHALERQLDQPAVDGVELCTGAQCIA
jgi:hypothetical protein